MTYLVERLVELRRHLEHLRRLRPMITDPAAVKEDLSLYNNVMYSLQTACQLIIDIAGELSARRNARFETYSEAIRNLAGDPRFPAEVAAGLQGLAGFRNVLVHEYIGIDMTKVIEALDKLPAMERFAEIVGDVESAG